jgi:hypothetical protein
VDLGDKIDQMLRGPLHFRFVVQPLIALILGLRDGRNDERLGHPPYLFGLLTQPGGRRHRLRDGLKAVAMPLALAAVMDAIVQSLLFHHVRLWSLVMVATLLVTLPYIATRGFSNRLLRRAHRLPSWFHPPEGTGVEPPLEGEERRVEH